jgi:hypothetical protein
MLAALGDRLGEGVRREDEAGKHAGEEHAP